jgi:hypothetical protein
MLNNKHIERLYFFSTFPLAAREGLQGLKLFAHQQFQGPEELDVHFSNVWFSGEKGLDYAHSYKGLGGELLQNPTQAFRYGSITQSKAIVNTYCN